MKSDFDIIINKIKKAISNNSYIANKVVIGFIGGPGSGKTTLSKELCKEFNMYLYSNDDIRRELDKYNLSSQIFEENQKAVKYIATKIHNYLYKLGISFVFDANIMNSTDFISNELKKYGYTFVLIKLECQKEIAINRIRERSKLSKENYDGYLEAYNRYLDNLEKVNIPEELISIKLDTTLGNKELYFEEVKRLINSVIKN